MFYNRLLPYLKLKCVGVPILTPLWVIIPYPLNPFSGKKQVKLPSLVVILQIFCARVRVLSGIAASKLSVLLTRHEKNGRFCINNSFEVNTKWHTFLSVRMDFIWLALS